MGKPSIWPQTSSEPYPILDDAYDLIRPHLKGRGAVVEKKGSLATEAWTTVSGSPVIYNKAGNCGVVGRARSLQSDRPGPILISLLTSSVTVGHFTPVHLSFQHLQNRDINSYLHALIEI